VPSHPSLGGRTFASDADVAGGDVGPATVFHYRETPDGIIEARYAGGAVRPEAVHARLLVARRYDGPVMKIR